MAKTAGRKFEVKYPVAGADAGDTLTESQLEGHANIDALIESGHLVEIGAIPDADKGE